MEQLVLNKEQNAAVNVSLHRQRFRLLPATSRAEEVNAVAYHLDLVIPAKGAVTSPKYQTAEMALELFFPAPKTPSFNSRLHPKRGI